MPCHSMKPLAALACLLVATVTPAGARELESRIVQEQAVQAYATRYRIDPERALRRLDIQDRAAGIEDEIAALLGEQYAGIWYDDADEGRLKVGVTRAAAAQTEAIRRLIDARELSRDANLVAVNYTEAELQRLQDSVRGEISGMVEKARASTAYDTRANAVLVRTLVRLEDGEEMLIRRLASKPGVSVQRLDLPSLAGNLDACFVTSCNPPFRGGRMIFGTGGCTSAFMARDKNGSLVWALTAGHCIYFEAKFGGGYKWNATDESHPKELLSFYPNYRFAQPDGRDMGKLWIHPGSYWATPGPIPAVVVKASDDTTYEPSYDIRSTARSSIGQWLCRTGAATGTECGQVDGLGADFTAKASDGYWYPSHNLGEIDVCDSDSGDSGGPLYKQHRAYGILSGDVSAGPAFCHEYYQGIRDTENVLGVDLLLQPF